MSKLRSLAFRGVRFADRVASVMPAIGPFRPLRKPFSAHEALLAGNLEGAVLHERQDCGPCPPGSITRLCGMGQHDHQPWPVFWTRDHDATLTGRIRVWRDAKDRPCREGGFQTQGRRRLSEDSLGAHMWPGPAHRLSGAWTSIASNWGDGRNYFHWITDNLTRLRLREHLPEETRILLPVSNAPYIAETLGMLGLESLAASPPQTHLNIERFYFCSPLAMSGVWNPLGFDWLRERFAPFFAPARSGPPVFLTRRGSNRIPAQLADLEQWFESKGFAITDCGKLSVREQIKAVSGAGAIAGIHGAAMTNILWASKGTRVLEIYESRYLNACYEQIAFQGQLDYTGLVLDQPSAMNDIRHWNP